MARAATVTAVARPKCLAPALTMTVVGAGVAYKERGTLTLL